MLDTKKHIDYFNGIIGKKGIITLKKGKTISGTIDLILYDIETNEIESITVITESQFKQVFINNFEIINVI